jgi:glycosyltransferase involved in cell wall biosynthesis
MKVAVVTPTVGSDHLAKCIESVQNQSYENLTHYLFLDGEEHYEKIHPVLYDKSGKRTIKTVQLEENIGKGWYGHRVYAACSFLVNSDVICYLDEDNWYEPNHVETIVGKIKAGYDWVYSFRNIYDKNGEFICEDNCESLGKWPVYFNPSLHHIDTSTFGVRRNIAVAVGHAWYGQWGADRQFFSAIKKHFPKFEGTRQHTCNYRLDGNPKSVTKEFFIQGNQTMLEQHDGEYPWKKKQVLSIGPGITLID